MKTKKTKFKKLKKFQKFEKFEFIFNNESLQIQLFRPIILIEPIKKHEQACLIESMILFTCEVSIRPTVVNFRCIGGGVICENESESITTVFSSGQPAEHIDLGLVQFFMQCLGTWQRTAVVLSIAVACKKHSMLFYFMNEKESFVHLLTSLRDQKRQFRWYSLVK